MPTAYLFLRTVVAFEYERAKNTEMHLMVIAAFIYYSVRVKKANQFTHSLSLCLRGYVENARIQTSFTYADVNGNNENNMHYSVSS